MNPDKHIPELLACAAKSPCSRDKRGALVVRDGGILGCGWNSPVGGECSPELCHHPEFNIHDEEVNGTWPEFLVRSCSGVVEHAEAMAIRDAVRTMALRLLDARDTAHRNAGFGHLFGAWNAGTPLKGCELIHMNTEPCRVVSNSCPCRACGDTGRTAVASRSGRACKSCAIQASQLGLSAIWLLHEDGWQRYEMADYYSEAIGSEI